MKISREVWQTIEPLLETGLELEAGARGAWLHSLEGTHAELLPMLRRMLDAHERAQRSGRLETVGGLAPAPPSNAYAPQARVGPYRLLRPLGRGGMGEVWLAEQADGRVERQVALKLPSVYLQSDVWRERFRRERDILARLTHPNIARLFDAGVSSDADSPGQPYLAMEFVEGLPLEEYAARHALNVRQRLELFRQVLAAVADAHRHLVVHRDLKPANILIDGSGRVKLLDFGIAKLLDDGATEEMRQDLTGVGGRVMTLRYAAPEQVTNGDISTATDIYALGVVLHELLTGRSPYRAVREGKGLTEAALLAAVTAVPSALAMDDAAAKQCGAATARQLSRQIQGDLDAIILKAMRLKPADRYGSVTLFDADIANHLDNLPVTARTGTWRYLAGRFVVRNKLPIAAAAAVLLTMLAGLGLVEQQRRTAVAERERAERHFSSVRQLANAFVFDVHSEIENLSGALKARQALVSTALTYLNSLASEGANDPGLALEVATAYRKLAEIKGDVYASYLGDVSSARKSVERAAGLLDSAQAQQPRNINILRERRILTLLQARLLTEAGDASSVGLTANAVAVAEQILTLPGAEPADRRNLAATLAEYGWALGVVKADTAAAAEPLKRAISMLQEMLRTNPGDIVARTQLAGAYERASIATEMSGRPEDLAPAIALMTNAVDTTVALVRDEPDNANHKQALVKRAINLADTQLANRDLESAAVNASLARDAVVQLIAKDPGSVGPATLQIRVLAVSSRLEYTHRNLARTAEFARAAIAAYERLPATAVTGFPLRANLSVARANLGLAKVGMAEDERLAREVRIGLLQDARKQFLLARAFRQELVDRKVDARSAAELVAELTEAVGRCEEQLKRLTQAS